MKSHTEIRRVAFIGTYLPRICGIATFTHDLCRAVSDRYREAECIVVPVNDPGGGYEYPPEVRFEMEEQDPESYCRAADFLNIRNTDVVCLQHEFGIYGGPAGSHVLGLLRDVRVPTVVTLHTVLDELSADQELVFEELLSLTTRVVVMSEHGRGILVDRYGVAGEKVDVIPHGVPDMPFVDPNFYKDQYGVEGKQVLLTFGLLSPNKGIEVALRALPLLIDEFPDLVYVVLGATHPNLVREQGEVYRLGLMRLARELGVAKHVVFYDRFVELEELLQFIGAADIYLTPYLNPKQSTSGTLAYAFGCGKAVIATAYWHAEELLAEGRGCLVPFGDSQAIAREVRLLLSDSARLSARSRDGLGQCGPPLRRVLHRGPAQPQPDRAQASGHAYSGPAPAPAAQDAPEPPRQDVRLDRAGAACDVRCA
jgi:glycosyltransferase involved in cell wall biosynthesis